MNFRRTRIFFCGLILLAAGPFLLGAGPPAKDGLVFGRIYFDRYDVFETGDDLDLRFPYFLANKLHIVSKESFLKRGLLFKEGDPYDPFLARETERRLRKLYLHRFVKIVPQPAVDGRVDICIQTEEVWTTSVRTSYRAAGGKNLYTLGVFEQNLLGVGVKLGAFAERDIDRFKWGWQYQDPYFLATPYEFTGGYGRDEKGREYSLGLQRPYKSVLDRRSEGVSVEVSDDEDRLFEDGDEIARFHHGEKIVRTEAGRSWRPNSRRFLRWRVIQYYEEDRFFDRVFLLPRPRPQNRTISAVLVGVEYGRVRYVKDTGVLTFDRDEDINLGWEWRWEAGPFLESLGSTRDGLFAKGEIRKNFHFGGPVYLFALTDLSGRLEREHVQNGELRFRFHTVARHWWRRYTATLTSEIRAARRPDSETQYLLGGENGLRGYSVRQFSGTKSFLLRLENRKVVLYDWLNLLNLGWAVFYDTGNVWEEKERPRLGDLRNDVGFGIRFSPTRSVSAAIIRADLAYALNDNDKDSPWVVNIGAFFTFGRPEKRKFDF